MPWILLKDVFWGLFLNMIYPTLPACAALLFLSVSAQINAQVTMESCLIRWTKPLDTDIASYILEINRSDGSIAEKNYSLSDVSGPCSEFMDEGEQVTARIFSVDSSGNKSAGGLSLSIETIDITPPNDPLDFCYEGLDANAQAVDICAQAQEATVRLFWESPTVNVDGSDLTDLAGYNLYRGEASRSYGTPLRLGNVTEVEVQSPGNEYFAVTARDHVDNESEFSNEVNN